VMIIGTPERFPCGKQIGSYVGLIPSEDSSAGRQRLGHIGKQGNTLLRYLLGEAAQAAARCDVDWRRRNIHLAMGRHKSIAKVAMGRRLGVRLYWMWRNGCEYSPLMEFGSYAGQLIRHGVELKHCHLVGHPSSGTGSTDQARNFSELRRVSTWSMVRAISPFSGIRAGRDARFQSVTRRSSCCEPRASC
jgi:Transposase IS116/IS110/IS902 family